MEFVDILDEDGNKTDVVKPRKDAHRDGDWHRTVHVWLLNPRQELLLQKRTLTRDTNPGRFTTSSSGHISAGATSLETAQQEVSEELGVNLEKKDFEFLFTNKQPAIQTSGLYVRHLNDVYLVTLLSPLTNFKLQAEEVSGVVWIPFQEFKQRLVEEKNSFSDLGTEYLELFQILDDRYPNLKASP